VLAVPVILFLLLMLMVGGIGIDVMRLERDRTQLQYTLDRAVLAAADMDQPLEQTEVIQDYMDKAGLGSYLTQMDGETTIGSRWAEATVDSTFTTQYMQLAGVEELPLHVYSRAEESIGNVEIVLVLDVSGSMNSNSRLTNLKKAAKEFVQTVASNVEEGGLTVSIVPYATQVTMPGAFFGQYNTSAEHSYSHCANFSGDDFSLAEIPTDLPLQQTMHFSPWSSSDNRPYGSLIYSPVCEAASDRVAMLYEKDVADIVTYIDDLRATGNTSIDVGMKWGSTLFHTSAKDAYEAAFGTHPDAGLTESERNSTLKVIVLMTDGQNTSQYYIKDQFHGEMSDVWYNAEKNVYSVYDQDYGVYRWVGFNRSMNRPFGAGNDTYCRKYRYGYCRSWITEGGTSVQLSYADLWAYTSTSYAAQKIYAELSDKYTAKNIWHYNVRSYVPYYTKDDRTRAICAAAGNADFLVHTIAFEAPENSQALLKECASDEAFYHDVEGLEISKAFKSIATSIRQLRLTQ
jgi:Flp pilus assembly protein TadG